jgi:3-deoxy-manno-octulosonate cytidylyltransferase (CMP-KDO synthetase)
VEFGTGIGSRGRVSGERPVAIIPARRGSTRLPAKPLLDVAGKPLVQWVYEAVESTGLFGLVLVATDSEEVAEAVEALGGEVEMTGSDHRSGTDRVAEAARRRAPDRVVVNVQGDQPAVTADSVRALLRALGSDSEAPMATVGARLRSRKDLLDRDTVKVVRDLHSRALYFSRAAIGGEQAANGSVLHHLGLYAFAPGFVETYASLPRTPIEISEDLEQLRVLEHGYPMAVAEIPLPLLEVNTPADLEVARKALSGTR